MIRYRLYYDKDTEIAWLNKMVQKGYAMKHFVAGFYAFEPCQKGEYTYQIDLLEDSDRSDFASFMEETGAEFVAQWYKWVYFRKKAADGPFELYTDAQSQIQQYTRIRKFFSLFFGIECISLGMEINAAITTHHTLFWVFTILLTILCFAFLRMIWKCGEKIDSLKKHIY